MYTKQSEILRSQTNAEEEPSLTSSSEELVERHEVPGSPLWIVKESNQWWIVLGKYRINHLPMQTKLEAEDYLLDNMWNVVTQIAIIIMNDVIIASQIQEEIK